jgi:hypothetical protein
MFRVPLRPYLVVGDDASLSSTGPASGDALEAMLRDAGGRPSG